MKKILTALIMITLFGATSCGLIQSNKRSLELEIQAYQGLLSAGEFEKANDFCTAEFKWFKEEKKYRGKGKRVATAFHDSLKNITNRDTIRVNIDKYVELQSGKYIAKGFIMVDQVQSGALRSVKFNVSMVWRKTKDGWQLIEVKELGPRENNFS